jgi:thioredoxin 1
MIHVDEEHFEEKVLKVKGLVLADHYADWCGPCKALAPVLERLEKRYKDKALFAKVDVDQNPSLAAANGVMGIPTIIAYKNGKEIDRVVGSQSEQQLAQKIEAWLKA